MCREQCRLEFVEGWRLKRQPTWFEFGHCVHYVLAKCYESHMLPTPGKIMALVREYAEDRRQRKNKVRYDDYDELQNELIYGICESLLPRYFQKWQADFKSNWLFTECNFSVPYQIGNRSIKLNGRFDGAYLSQKGHLWFIDHKTLGLIDEDGLNNTLQFDIQCMMYLLAGYALREKYNWPKPAGIIYNILRKPGLRRKVDESIEDFCKRCASDIDNRPDYYFIRITIPVDENELSTWRKNQFDIILSDIIRWWENRCRSYVNPGSLINKYGRCNMFDMITSGDTSKYYKAEKCFEELIEE